MKALLSVLAAILLMACGPQHFLGPEVQTEVEIVYKSPIAELIKGDGFWVADRWDCMVTLREKGLKFTVTLRDPNVWGLVEQGKTYPATYRREFYNHSRSLNPNEAAYLVSLNGAVFRSQVTPAFLFKDLEKDFDTAE